MFKLKKLKILGNILFVSTLLSTMIAFNVACAIDTYGTFENINKISEILNEQKEK